MPATYEPIATQTLASATSTITFSSIPATYTDLRVVVVATIANAGYDVVMRFNSDTGSNYAFHFIYGTGASALAAAASTQTSMVMGTTPDATYPCVAVVDILDYANTNKYKTVRTLAGIDRNGSGYVYLQSGLWQSTAAISTITINSPTGNYNQYSSFALFGIKG